MTKKSGIRDDMPYMTKFKLQNTILPILISLLVSVIVLSGVIFKKGFIFSLDFVWTPNQHFDKKLSLELPMNFLEYLSVQVFGGELAQRIFLILTLSLLFYSGYYFGKNIAGKESVGYLIGSLLVLNPFVFERLSIGHYQILLGLSFLIFSLSDPFMGHFSFFQSKTDQPQAGGGESEQLHKIKEFVMIAGLMALTILVSPHFFLLENIVLTVYLVIKILPSLFLPRPTGSLWEGRVGWVASIHHPLSTFDNLLNLFQHPLSTFDNLLNLFQHPLSTFGNLLNLFQHPLSAFKFSKIPKISLLSKIFLPTLNFLSYLAIILYSVNNKFTDEYLVTFATERHEKYGLIFNLINFRGFWLERTIFSDSVPFGYINFYAYSVLLFGILTLSILSLVLAKKFKELGFASSLIFLGLILASGSSGIFGNIFLFLYNDVPILNGMREPQKFLALYILGCMILIAYGLKHFSGLMTICRNMFGIPFSLLTKSHPVLLPAPCLPAGRGTVSKRGNLNYSSLVIGLLSLLFISFLIYSSYFIRLTNYLVVRDYPEIYYQAEREFTKFEKENGQRPVVLIYPAANYIQPEWIGIRIADPAPKFFSIESPSPGRRGEPCPCLTAGKGEVIQNNSPSSPLVTQGDPIGNKRGDDQLTTNYSLPTPHYDFIWVNKVGSKEYNFEGYELVLESQDNILFQLNF